MVLPSNYVVLRKQVKHIRIRVNVECNVRITVPLDFTDNELALLLQKKQVWIDSKIKLLSIKRPKIIKAANQILLHGERYNYVYWERMGRRVVVNHQHRTIQSGKNLLEIGLQEKWYRKYARETLLSLTEELAKRYRFSYNRVYIRSQSTKWGNCSSKKNISLNWRLVKAPSYVVDYVIIHELLHTEIMNHSGKFWMRLQSIYPNYRKAVSWLKKYNEAIA